MSAGGVRRSLGMLLGGVLLWTVTGCAVTADDGYTGQATVGVGVDFYEPWGFDYGGWGPGYGVGPIRGGGGRHGYGGGGGGHAYRPAAPTRAMPSIPSGAGRGGGRSRGGARR